MSKETIEPMAFEEKRTLVTLFTSLAVSAIYAVSVFNTYQAGGDLAMGDFRTWANSVLGFIAASVVAQIVANIILSIFQAAATGKAEEPITDERDTAIELRSIRASHFVFLIGFIVSLIVVAVGFQPVMMIFILIASGLGSEIAGAATKIYLYRRGI